MIDQTTVKETIELLERVRAEVHGDVDNIVVEQLNEAIWKLKETQRSQSVELTSKDVLVVLGKALEALPAITQLLDFLNDCI